MAFRLARPGALAVIAVSLALPASASAADSSGGAGLYVGMPASGTQYDFAFMHLQPGSVRVHPGQSGKPGRRIGSVGHTGDASGPHLHFEVWVGAWQMGGHPIDPLPLLRSWDR